MNPQHETKLKSSSPLHDDNARLELLIRRDTASSYRGKLAAEFKEVINPYLVTDLNSEQFLHIHRAATPYPAASSLKSSMTVGEFMDFLGNYGLTLRDQYLNFKSRGFTGCVIVADEATHALNNQKRDCATTRSTSDGVHFYTVVSVEGRDYRLDFTIDQFVAYPEVIERHRIYATTRRMDPSPSFAGTLVMPFREI